MRAQIPLGSVFGIKIGLHYSWLIIAFLISLSLGSNFAATNPEWGPGIIWATAIVTAVLFFVTIVVHELSHAMVAKSHGLPVRSITLFALGGVAEIEQEAGDARTEFWLGIVGPITSFVIGTVCLAVLYGFGWKPPHFPRTPLLAMLMWIGYINIMLAVFNMVPGFPLDGGRVLRAIVWWITGDASRSTRISAKLGQLVAFAFIIFGIYRFFNGAGIGGLWIAFIGWFLLSASRESYAQVAITEALKGLRVRDVMSQDYPTVESHANLQTLVDEHFLRMGRRCFFVSENGRIVGLITPHEVREVERQRWPFKTVDEAMRSLDQLRTVNPDTPIKKALEIMGSEDVNQLPVVEGNEVLGILTRSHILQLLQTRAELRA
jgi:Zn-dependent protease/predicted transcriptional regulator